MFAAHPLFVQAFYWKSQTLTLWCQCICKVTRIYCFGSIKVCAEFHDNPWNSCWGISGRAQWWITIWPYCSRGWAILTPLVCACYKYVVKKKKKSWAWTNSDYITFSPRLRSAPVMRVHSFTVCAKSFPFKRLLFRLNQAWSGMLTHANNFPIIYVHMETPLTESFHQTIMHMSVFDVSQ